MLKERGGPSLHLTKVLVFYITFRKTSPKIFVHWRHTAFFHAPDLAKPIVFPNIAEDYSRQKSTTSVEVLHTEEQK